MSIFYRLASRQSAKTGLRLLLIGSFVILLIALTSHPAQAWPTMPTVNGTIASNEYGNHTDGQNQQTSGGTIWYMTWDDSNLYIGISNANRVEAAVIYLDVNPITPINGGANSHGTLSGQAYDGTNFAALPFRADFVAYWHSSYREYRTANGSGGWSAQTTGFGTYADNGSNVRELSIPWANITGSGRPPSFTWFGYLTSTGGYVYGQVPTENSAGTIGTAAYYSRYYTVSNTGDGTSTPPFSRNSYVFNAESDITNFGAIDVYDFTMNATGRTITRSSGSAGGWTIRGNLNISTGRIDFGSAASQADVRGDVSIGPGGTLALSSVAGGDIQVAGNFTLDGTFTPNQRAVLFDGTSLVSSGTSTSIHFDDIAIHSSCSLQVGNNLYLIAHQNVTNAGTIMGDLAHFYFYGPTFSNQGAVTIYDFAFYGNGSQVAGTGTWTGTNLAVASGANVSLAHAITFAPASLYISAGATVFGSNTWRNGGSVSMTQLGNFNAPFEVQSGATTIAHYNIGTSHTFNGPITVDATATFQVANDQYAVANGNVTVLGSLANATPTGGIGHFYFYGPTFSNQGAVTIYDFAFYGNGSQVAGTGTWTGTNLAVASGANVSLAHAITFAPASLYISAGATVSGSNTWRNSGPVSMTQLGSFNAPFEVQSGATTIAHYDIGTSHTFNGPITVDATATFQVANDQYAVANGNVTVLGSLANATPTGGIGHFYFYGPTFSNQGAVTIYDFAFYGNGSQVAGTGTWTGTNLVVASGANVSLAHAITFAPASLYISAGATVFGSNTWRNGGSVSMTQLGNFNAPFEVLAGTTTLAHYTNGTIHRFDGPIHVDAMATLQVDNTQFFQAYGTVLIDGELSGAAAEFHFYGPALTNNGNSITIASVTFAGTGAQTVAGSGAWTGRYLAIASSAVTRLASDMTLSVDELALNGSLNLDTYTLTIDASTALSLVNTGTLTAGTGTLACNAPVTLSGSGTYDFHHVTIEALGGLVAPTGNIFVSGNWSNAGSFDHQNGQITFDGTTQNLALDVPTAFYDIYVSGTSTLIETEAADNATISHMLTNDGVIRKTLSTNGNGGLTGVQLSGYTGLDGLQIERIDSNIPNASASLATGIHWVLTPTGDGTVTITLPDTPPGSATIANANRACYDSGDGSPFTCADPEALSMGNVDEATLFANPYWAIGANASPTAVIVRQFSAHTRRQPITGTLSLIGLLALAVSLHCISKHAWHLHRR